MPVLNRAQHLKEILRVLLEIILTRPMFHVSYMIHNVCFGIWRITCDPGKIFLRYIHVLLFYAWIQSVLNENYIKHASNKTDTIEQKRVHLLRRECIKIKTNYI